MLLNLALLLLGAAPEAPGFPVALQGGNTAQALNVADLDGDRTLDIIVMSEPGMTVIDSHGKDRPGFPVQLRETRDVGRVTFDHPAAACDLDGDMLPELVAAGSNGHLYALSRYGQMMRGFPVALGGVPKGPVSCVPVKGTNKRDIALTTNEGALVVVGPTGGAPRVLAQIGKGAEAGVGVADLDRDGVLELVTVGGDSKLYAVAISGKALKGFPVQLEFRAGGTPAIADIDEDGKLDIVVGAQDFSVHAMSLAGKELAGFPLATKYRIYGGVAIADMDRDGALDVVAASGDGGVYAVRGNGGAPFAGFPLHNDGRILVGPVVGDVDRDGYADIAVLTQSGQLVVVDRNGKAVPGFPVKVAERGEVAAALADVDGDGLPEVVACGREGQLHAYVVKARGQATGVIVEWPVAGHDPEHTGRYGPNPARFLDLSLGTDDARVGDALKAMYTYVDLDGDPEEGTQIRWHADNAVVADLNNQKTVPGNRLKKGQTWFFTVQDGVNFRAVGDTSAASRVFTSPSLSVKDTAPKAAKVDITPASPDTDAILEARVLTKATDADGDPLQYKYTWIRDGVPQKLGTDVTTIDPHLTTKNEEWRVVVIPFDGENEGEPAMAHVTIKNTPPGAPEIAFAPEAPRITDVISVTMVKKARDEDGDALTYAYRYWLNDAPLDVAETTTSFPARFLHKRDTLKVEVTVHDDESVGGKATASIKLKNTPPEAPTVVTWPKQAFTDDAITFGVTQIPEDPDHDVITFRHQWYVDGTKVDAPIVVPKEKTKKGQRWKVVVTPFDGEAEGDSANADVLIENTPPTAPLVTIDKPVFAPDETIAPKIAVAAHDADGDALTLSYKWQKNAQSAGLSDSKKQLGKGDTHAGETWTLSVIASDGEVDGPPGTVTFSIGAPAKGAPKVTLTPAGATTKDTITATLAKKEAGEPRYRWYRNNSLVTAWPLTKATLAPGEAKKGEVIRVDVSVLHGEQESGATSATLRIADAAPEPPTITLGPPKATGERDLACDIVTKSDDADGDMVSYRVRWLMNNQGVPLATDQMSVPATLTAKGQSWFCEITAHDGELASKPVRSAPLVVADAPPTTPKISISPAKADTNANLVCELDAPATDDDFDVLKYRYSWKVNGKPWAAPGGTLASRVPAKATTRGETWECEVVVNDGELSSTPVVARLTIADAPPPTPRVAIQPEKATAGVDLSCAIVEQPADPDGDKVTYRYGWTRNGVDQGFAPGSVSVPGRLVKAHDLWSCVATPIDGVLEGKGGASSEITIGESTTDIATRETSGIGRERRRRH